MSALGAVLANRVTADLAAALHVPEGQASTGSTSALNLKALRGPSWSGFAGSVATKLIRAGHWSVMVVP